MKLQKLRHSQEDIGDECIVTHIVNEIEKGGEYTYAVERYQTLILKLTDGSLLRVENLKAQLKIAIAMIARKLFSIIRG